MLLQTRREENHMATSEQSIACQTPSLLVRKSIARFHPANTPHLLLVLDLVATEPEATSAAFGLLPLPRLAAEPESDALEVLLHAPLGARRQRAAGVGACHVFVEDLGFLVDDVEDGEESRLGRELNRDDHVADGGEYGRDDSGQVRADSVVVLACDGAGHDEGQAAGVNCVAWRDDLRKSVEDGLGGLVALVARLCEEELASCEDAVVGDKRLGVGDALNDD